MGRAWSCSIFGATVTRRRTGRAWVTPTSRTWSALLERLERARRETAVMVIGRSLGATVAILAAAETDRIAGVVAVAPYETLRVPLRQRLRLRGLPSGYTSPGSRSRGSGSSGGALAPPAPRRLGPTSRYSWWFWATQDPISPPGRCDGDRGCGTPRDVCEVVAGAGHGNHWDLAGDRLDAAVDQLIHDASTSHAGSGADVS